MDIKLRQTLLDTFKFTIELCEKNNIRYFTCGGTTLGAVRHHDLIPWDDDIDIYIPRADYNRFLMLKPELRDTGYDIVSLSDKNYYAPFAKLVNTQTTIIEKRYNPFFIVGIYVDVFPLDYFDQSDDEIFKIQKISTQKFNKYLYRIRKYDIWYWWWLITDIHPNKLRNSILSLFRTKSPSKYLNDFLDFEKTYSQYNGNKCLCVTQWKGKVFSKKWFDEYVEMPFADFTVRVPKGYHEYLTTLYGDYMTLPPLDKQVSNHEHYYVNIDKRLSFEEIRRLNL